MSLQTQAVVSGHLTVEDICLRLRETGRASDIVARPGRHSDYWIVEFVDDRGGRRALHTFLNSWAAEDYAELGANESTLLSLEFAPDSPTLAEAVIGPSMGWMRRNEADSWTTVTAN